MTPTRKQNIQALTNTAVLCAGIYVFGAIVGTHPDPFPAVIGFFFGFRSGVLSA
jgi:hypothetical protein